VTRTLIVNADDFGRTRGINRGIARAHEQGIVTSASLMVRWPAAVEAAEFGRNSPRLSVGLHLDLGEWTQVNGEWHAVYQVTETREEVRRQLNAFKRLMGRDPSHLDSHQHVHRHEPVRSLLLELGEELGVSVRHFGAVRYEGGFYGQDSNGEALTAAISVHNLLAMVRALPVGVTELACHPGYVDGLDSAYADEREGELEALCDPRVRSVIATERIDLRSF